MKISLTKEFLDTLKKHSLRSLVKIIKIEKNSTLISIKGKQLKIPFILKKDTIYNALIKNNEIEIFEDKTKNKIVKNRINILLKQTWLKFFLIIFI